MLEGIIVIEPLVGQPVVEGRQPLAREIVCNEVEVGQAIIVFNDFG